jgi:carbonic anhydrase/acetyltransferase-like protein (isoleucine patch superfamily)
MNKSNIKSKKGYFMYIELNGSKPQTHPTAFVGEGAKIIGEVTIQANASIWYNAVLRGDLAPIMIGEGSNIQDNSTVHVETNKPTIVGKNVTVGHNAIIHACTIEDNVLIGMGAIILNGAHIGKNCLIGAGTIVTENKVIPEGSLVIGTPGKIVRELTSEEIENIHISAIHYQDQAKQHKGVK